MSIHLFTFVFVLALFTTDSQSLFDFPSCETSSNAVGLCIPLSNLQMCPIMFNSEVSIGTCTNGTVCCSLPSVGGNGGCGIKGMARLGRITGSDYASGKEYCWNAYLFRNTSDSNTYLGAGVVISKDVVITTATNVKNVKNSELVIYIGDYENGTCAQYRGAQIITHPKFSSSNSITTYNIAKLKLNDSLQFDETCVCQVCLPTPTDNFDGKTCTVTGIGHSSNVDQDTNIDINIAILKEVDIPILNSSYCQQLLKSNPGYTLHESNMCAGGELNRDACQKDGGGGLFCDKGQGTYVVAGLVSGGFSCGLSNVPGIYTRITSVLDFINAA